MFFKIIIAILTDPNLMDLLYETPVIDIIQSLLGIGNMSPCLECGISLRYPQLTGDNPNSGTTNSKKLELGGRRSIYIYKLLLLI